MTASATAQSLLLGELLDAISDGFLVPCGDEHALLAVLDRVDFSDPLSLRRATNAVSRWRLGEEVPAS